MDIAPWTWGVLAVVQTLHLLHHRLARRHISFAEVTSSALLLVPPAGIVPDLLLASAHGMMAAIQGIGSIWIDRLSPDWDMLARTAREGRRS